MDFLSDCMLEDLSDFCLLVDVPCVLLSVCCCCAFVAPSNNKLPKTKRTKKIVTLFVMFYFLSTCGCGLNSKSRILVQSQLFDRPRRLNKISKIGAGLKNKPSGLLLVKPSVFRCTVGIL